MIVPSRKRSEPVKDGMHEEVCVWCGRSVALGSDLFIDREELDETLTMEERIDSGWKYPTGVYCCYQCDNEWRKENPYYQCLKCGFMQLQNEPCLKCGCKELEEITSMHDEEEIKALMDMC